MLEPRRFHSVYRTAVAAILILVLGAMGLSGCSSSQTANTTENPASAAAAPAITEIRLGAAFPVTGKESKIGSAMKEATEYAVNEVNQAGGLEIDGKKVPVKLVVLDDTTDPTKSAQLVEQLVTEHKVHVLVGGYSTLLVQAQVVVPERYSIPWVTGGASSNNLFGNSKWVFGLLSPVELLAKTQMEYLADLMNQGKLPKPTTVALVWENTDHGRDYQTGVRAYTKEHPESFKILFDEGFELYAPDFRPILTKVQNVHADVFMADTHLEDYVSMHRTYTQMGLSHKMVTYGARGADKSAREGLGAATDYIFASTWWSPLLASAQSKAFTSKWKSTHDNKSPEWYHATGYETVRVILKAVQQAGSTNPDKIRDALAKIEFKDSILPGGVAKFSPSGVAVYPFVVTQNKPGNKIDLVWPKADKTGDSVAPIPTAK